MDGYEPDFGALADCDLNIVFSYLKPNGPIIIIKIISQIIIKRKKSFFFFKTTALSAKCVLDEADAEFIILVNFSSKNPSHRRHWPIQNAPSK